MFKKMTEAQTEQGSVANAPVDLNDEEMDALQGGASQFDARQTTSGRGNQAQTEEVVVVVEWFEEA